MPPKADENLAKADVAAHRSADLELVPDLPHRESGTLTTSRLSSSHMLHVLIGLSLRRCGRGAVAPPAIPLPAAFPLSMALFTIYPAGIAASDGVMRMDVRDLRIVKKPLDDQLYFLTFCDIGVNHHSFGIKCPQ